MLFAVVLVDPVHILWLNSVQVAFSLLLFLYLTISLAIIVVSFSDKLLYRILLGGALFLLGTTQVPWRFLPLLIALVVFFHLRGNNKKVLGSLLIWALCCGAALGLQATSARGEEDLSAGGKLAAQNTNTILGTVLPAFEDPIHGARVLGLPEKCSAHSGKTWQALRALKKSPCPEVHDISTLKLLGVMITNPGVLWRMIDRGLTRSRPWAHLQTAHAQGTASEVAIPAAYLDQPEVRRPRGLSILLNGLPEWLYRACLFLMAATALMALVGLLLSLIMGARSIGPAAMIVLLLAISAVYLLLASLFSNGTVEFASRTHLLFACMTTSIVALVLSVIGDVIDRIRGG